MLEINEDNFDQTVGFIRKWLLKIPDYKYSLVSIFFELLFNAQVSSVPLLFYVFIVAGFSILFAGETRYY